MEIKYDTSIEVTEIQYSRLMVALPGIVAGRVEKGKYYIKCWMMRHKLLVEQNLNL